MHLKDPTESELTDLNESFVRSDIAKIISKMYSPVPQCPLSEEVSDAVQGDNNSSREEVWELVESPRKRFGFYFESITDRNNLDASKYSSTSDTVSVPSFRSYQKKRHGSVCRCCKQQIQHRIAEKRKKNGCDHCKRKYLDEDRIESSKKKNGNGDFENETVCKVEHIKHVKLSDSVSGGKGFSEIDQELDGKQGDWELYPTILSPQGIDRDKVNVERKDSASHQMVRCSNSCSPGMCNFSQQACSIVQNHPAPFSRQNTADLQVVPKIGEGDSVSIAIQEEANHDSYSKSKSNTNFSMLLRNANTLRWIFSRKMKSPTNESELHLPLQNVNPEKMKSTCVLKQIYNNEISLYSKCQKSYHHSITNNKFPFEMVPEREQSQESLNKNKLLLEKSTLINVNKFYDRESQIVPQREERLEYKNYDSRENCPGQVDRKSTIKATCDEETSEGNEVNELWSILFWKNIFAICHKAISFFTYFPAQLLKFLLHSVVHPLLWGNIHVISKNLFQPCLGTLYNSILKPIFMFLQNLAESFRDLCQPLAQTLGYFVNECSCICRGCRLVEIHQDHTCKCEHCTNPNS